jgi:hypothetical protein
MNKIKKLQYKTCINCNKEFQTYSRRRVYCCLKCAGAFNRKKRREADVIVRKCQQCGNVFTTKSKEKMHCSNECLHEHKKNWDKNTMNRIKARVCICCGKNIAHKRDDAIYCSIGCRAKYNYRMRESPTGVAVEEYKHRYDRLKKQPPLPEYIRPDLTPKQKVAAIQKSAKSVIDTKNTLNGFYERIGFTPSQLGVGAGFQEIKKENNI